jgi:hypothetical protein
MTKFRKGQHVTYGLDKLGKGCKVQAIIRRVHRDDTATVEARFFVDADGKLEGCYPGYRYRCSQDNLCAA